MIIIRTAIVIWAGFHRAGAKEHGDHLRGGVSNPAIVAIPESVHKFESALDVDGRPGNWMSKLLRLKKTPSPPESTTDLPSEEHKTNPAPARSKMHLEIPAGFGASGEEAPVFIADDADDNEGGSGLQAGSSKSFPSSEGLPVALSAHDQHVLQVQVSACVHEFVDRADLKTAIDLYVAQACSADPGCAAGQTYGYPMNSWCVGAVDNMERIFEGTENRIFREFNEDISDWDVSSVTATNEMFKSAYAFNVDISRWNISSLIMARGMFNNARSFNIDLSSWAMPSRASTLRMFYKAEKFNQDLCAWGDGFKYRVTTDMFFGTDCTFKSDPIEGTCGPFCASECSDAPECQTTTSTTRAATTTPAERSSATSTSANTVSTITTLPQDTTTSTAASAVSTTTADATTTAANELTEPYCGCTSCDQDAWDTEVTKEGWWRGGQNWDLYEKHTCGTHVQELINNNGFAYGSACFYTGMSYPALCKACDPSQCETDTATTFTEPYCGCTSCTQEVWDTEISGTFYGNLDLYDAPTCGTQTMEWVRRGIYSYPVMVCYYILENPECEPCNPSTCEKDTTTTEATSTVSTTVAETTTTSVTTTTSSIEFTEPYCGCTSCTQEVWDTELSGEFHGNLDLYDAPTCGTQTIEWANSNIYPYPFPGCMYTALINPDECAACNPQTCEKTPTAPTPFPTPRTTNVTMV